MTEESRHPLISIVIPNYNGASYLEPCLQSLKDQTYANFEILVVDNGSRDSSCETVNRAAPHARLLRQQRNLGFAGGANAGINAARGEWIAVLNNDTLAGPDWLQCCVAAMQRYPEASFLACRILDLKNRELIYSAGDCFLRTGIGYRRGQEQANRGEYDRDTEIFSAGGCAAIYRKAVLQELGAFDERFFAYLEDVELSLRLRGLGHRGYYVASAVVFHHGGATSGGEFSPLSIRLRTRNSILLPLRSLPAAVLWRCLPWIAVGQLSWLLRVLGRGKLLSYLRGLAGVVPLILPMLRSRAWLRRLTPAARRSLWAEILKSETMARQDFQAQAEPESTFLRWYFRLS